MIELANTAIYVRVPFHEDLRDGDHLASCPLISGLLNGSSEKSEISGLADWMTRRSKHFAQLSHVTFHAARKLVVMRDSGFRARSIVNEKQLTKTLLLMIFVAKS